MKNTQIRILKNLVMLIICMTCIIGTTSFTMQAGMFVIRHSAVISAETNGKTPTNTANGPQTWLPSEVELYNKATEAREELVKSSDIAKFCFDCGGTATGRIVRLIVCLFIILLDLVSVRQAYVEGKCIFTGIRRIIRAKTRNLKKMNHSEETNSKNTDDTVQYAECKA